MGPIKIKFCILILTSSFLVHSTVKMAPVSQPCSKKTKNANINSKNKQHENIKKKKKKNVFFKSAPKPTEETEKPAEAGKLKTNPMKTTAKLPGNREKLLRTGRICTLRLNP